MSRPAIPLDICRVVVEGHVATLPWVNTFWLHTPSSSTPSGTQVSALAHAFLAAYNTAFVPGMIATSATTQCIVEWNDGGGGVVDGTDATPVSGSAGGAALPASAAFILSWRLGVRYRGGHPRTYLGGQSTTYQNDPATWTTSHVSAMQTATNTFLSTINALSPAPFTSVSLGVLRQFANGGSETKPPTFLNPPVFRPFTSVICKPGIATQRRRLGNNLN